jgi:hypothetical protein
MNQHEDEPISGGLCRIDSLTFALEDGQQIRVTEISPAVAAKTEETRKVLRREDRTMWALRHFKKGLALELLWLARNDPKWFAKKRVPWRDILRGVCEGADHGLGRLRTAAAVSATDSRCG